MPRPSEDYYGPVGFAREPREDRRRLVGRIFTLLLMLLIAWLFFARVLTPPPDNPTFDNPGGGIGTELPGPI